MVIIGTLTLNVNEVVEDAAVVVVAEDVAKDGKISIALVRVVVLVVASDVRLLTMHLS